MTTHKAHILVVDDDLSHCTIIQALMKGWGYQTTPAHNGLEAIELAKEIPFDLILTDVRMSEMDGIEALKAIKAYNPAIPILIMTAYSNVESAVEAIKAGHTIILPNRLISTCYNSPLSGHWNIRISRMRIKHLNSRSSVTKILLVAAHKCAI